MKRSPTAMWYSLVAFNWLSQSGTSIPESRCSSTNFKSSSQQFEDAWSFSSDHYAPLLKSVAFYNDRVVLGRKNLSDHRHKLFLASPFISQYSFRKLFFFPSSSPPRHLTAGPLLHTFRQERQRENKWQNPWNSIAPFTLIVSNHVTVAGRNVLSCYWVVGSRIVGHFQKWQGEIRGWLHGQQRLFKN